jgi:hypothetical protein
MRVVEELDEPLRSLAKLCVIGAAMDNCNAYRDGKCLRYRRTWSENGFNHKTFCKAFEIRAQRVLEDLEIPFPTPPKARVHLADAREGLPAQSDGFALCVTSPPYLNSFDYTDIYRPELFLGGFINGAAELKALRQETVRSHVQANWPRPTNGIASKALESALRRITSRREQLWDYRIPFMLTAYFEDIRRVLRHARRLARKGAYVWLVVATSAYAGVEVPVDKICAEIGQAVGWKIVEIGLLRNLRSSGQHWNRVNGSGRSNVGLRESVVIMHC